jgi:hypothetical protein
MWFTSFAIQKGSPYKEFMSNVILQITENGHLSWIISRVDPKTKPQDCMSGLAKGNPLGLKKISFPFFVAFLGLLLSVLTVLLEKLLWKPTSCQWIVNKPKLSIQKMNYTVTLDI